MSLKSGLLAESTWAMDALNILLYDDSTIAYFHLKHFPGMLNILLEHYLKCLKLVFNKENGNEFNNLLANNYPFDDNEDENEYDVETENEENEYDSNSEGENEENQHFVNNNNNYNINSNHNNIKSDNSDVDSLDAEEDNYSDSSDLNDPKAANNHYSNKKNNFNRKKLNGYCSSSNNNNNNHHNSSEVGKVNHNKHSKRGRKPKVNNNINNSNLETTSKLINSDIYNKYKHLFDDDLKIMRINFNDRDTLNRFLHYYKSFKFNDSKVCEYWYKYNENIIDKLKHNNQTHNIIKNKKLKLNNEKVEVKKREKRELNNYILTNFSTNNDLTTLNKLFYGRYYEAVKLEQKINKKLNDRKERLTINLNSNVNTNKTIIDNTDSEIEKLKKLNSEFIKRHQTKSCINNEASTNNNINNSNSKKIYEDQITTDEESIFKIANQSNLELMNRVICLSTIFRNLSFVPGNDVELCKNPLLLKILGRLITFKHTHNIKISNKKLSSQQHLVQVRENSENNNLDEIENNDKELLLSINAEDYLDEEFECIKQMKNKNLLYKINQSTKNLPSGDEWWWDCVQILRENTLVTIANISSTLNLNTYEEDVIELFAHGLVHWSICKSNDAQDTLSTLNETSLLSPQRLAIESLSKMTINDDNVDLVLTSIYGMRSYLETFVNQLCTEWLLRRDDQTLREFSIVLITALAKCDQFASRLISRQSTFLISFLEDFEEQTRRIAASNPNLVIPPSYYINNMINNQNNESNSNINEEHLGTTVDMLRRCSNCIMYLSVYNENIPFIMKHENRLLDLTTSQYVDYKVSQTLAEVLFYCSSKMNETTLKFAKNFK
jgi:hypothetical protein